MENSLLRKNYLAGAILVLLLTLYYPINAQITVMEPQSLITNLNSTKISGSTATFGTPYYGSRLVGIVKYYDTTGCDKDSYNITEEEMPVIVMLHRGDCDFIEKTYIAEQNNAHAIIIIDSTSGTTYKDIRKVIMSKGNNNVDVDIPALLIGEVEGSKMIKSVEDKEDIIVELSWSMPKSEWTEMDLWMSPAVSDSIKFIEEFSIDSLSLKQKLDFYPHYWVISLKQNYMDKCWDEKGRYCSVNAEWDSNVTGRKILEEIIREVCLYEGTQSYDYPQYYSEAWWKYMSKIRKKCMVKNSHGESKFGETCSYELMKELGVDLESIKTCCKESGEEILRHELLTTAWSPMAVIINGWHYSGDLEADTVAKAVCTGFNEPPTECTDIFYRIENQYNDNFNSGIGAGSIIALSLIASAITIISIGILFWKFLYPRIRSNMRYVVMNEVHKEVQRHKGEPLAFDKREIGQPRQYLF